MKLAVVCSTSRLDSLPYLREVLDGLLIEYRAWFDHPDLSAAESINSLEQCLGYSTYLLCIVSADDFNTNWLYYTLGHQRGRTDRLAFWVRPEDADSVPEWTDGFTTISGNEKDIFGYYAEVEETWGEEIREFIARRTLDDSNIDVSARSFVETVQKGDRYLTGLFLDVGFSPQLRDSSGVPVLNLAIRSGHFSLVEPIIEAGADLNGVADDRGTTALMDAAASGFEDLTCRMIQMNAVLDTVSKDGQTAVILAAGNGHSAAAVALIKGGADVDTKDMLGMSARKYATLYGQQDILKVIENKQ